MARHLSAITLTVGGLAIALVFSAILLGDTFFYSDYSHIYHPLVRWATQQWSAGAGPWWNPDIGLGLPQAANPIVGTFYPPNLLLVLLPFTWGLNLLIVAHIGLAFVGTHRLLAALGAGPWGALAGGVSFALSGALISSTSYVFPILAWAWVPLTLCGALRGSLARTAIPLALTVLAGSPIAAAITVALALCLRAPARLVALSAFAAVGLAAIQLLPTALFVPHSVRSTGIDAEATLWSLHPERLAGFVLPDFWGRWAPEFSLWGQSLTDGRNDGNFFYYSIYLGVTALVVAPLAFADTDRRPVALGLGCALGVALLLALGKHTPLYPVLVEWVPGFGIFRYPEKWVMPATLCLALLGGLGLDRLSRPDIDARFLRAGLLIAAAIGLAALGVLLAGETMTARIERLALVPVTEPARAVQVTGATRALVVAILAGGALLLSARRLSWLVPALALVAVVDVAGQARTLVWPGDPAMFTTSTELLEAIEPRTGVATPRIGRHPGLDAIPHHRDLDGLVETYRRHNLTLRANSALENGVRRVGAESPARVGHAMQPEEWLWEDPVRAAPMLGADLLLFPIRATDERLAPALEAGELKPVLRVDAVSMAIAAPAGTALPDAFCVDGAVLAKPEDVVERLASVNPRRRAVVEARTAGAPIDDETAGLLAGIVDNTAPSPAWDCASVTTRTNTAWEIEVTTDRPALLIVRDAFAAGWSAGDRPILRAYGSLKALAVEPGSQTIALRYAVPGLPMGAALSLITLVAVLFASRRQESAEDTPGSTEA